MTLPAASSAPYLSVVVAARNDNHGGDMLRRMQAFVDCWIAQAKRYGICSEIVIVEWNPPPDRPRLIHDLHWPGDPSPCEIRFLEVPLEIHERFANAAAIPLHQMIAKNVGIRRARGRFVLATNLDILLSAALMQFLAARTLEPGTMYRIDRLDIARNLPESGDVDEVLAFAEQHVLRVFGREGGIAIDSRGLPATVDDDIVAPCSGIRLLDGWHGLEILDVSPCRWTGPDARLLFQRPPGVLPNLLLDVETGPGAGAGPVHLRMLDSSGSVLCNTNLQGRAILRLHTPRELISGTVRLQVEGRGLPLRYDPRILHLCVRSIEWEPAPERVRTSAHKLNPDIPSDAGGSVTDVSPFASNAESVTRMSNLKVAAVGNTPAWTLETLHGRPARDWSATSQAIHPLADRMPRHAFLHTDACGDFTVLAREDWHRLRGYAEFPVWPMHIDALFCYSAFHAGIRELILRDPMRIYHIEHGSAAGWTPEGEASRAARLTAKGLSEMSYSEFTGFVNQMRRLDAPLIFTLSNWGLGDLDLVETRV